MSPKHQDEYNKCNKLNYPLECKPNINDLRQLFDDSSRHESKKSHRHSAIYSDAKHTIADEIVYNGKTNHHQSLSIVTAAIPSSRHPDFERVKQKFDKPMASHSPSSSSTRSGKKTRNFSSFLKFNNKRNEPIPVINDPSNHCDAIGGKHMSNTPSLLMESCDSVDSTQAIAGDGLMGKKIDAYMNSSMNIDGLKVSEDDDDEDGVSID